MKKKQALEIPASARSPEEWAISEILRAAEHLHASYNDALKPFGVSFTQYGVLQILGSEEQGLPSSAIGEQMTTRDSDVTRLVDRLVAKGWAERRRDPGDRRIVWVRLTAAGRDLLGQVEGPILALAGRQFAGIKPKRIRRLLEALGQLRDASS